MRNVSKRSELDAALQKKYFSVEVLELDVTKKDTISAALKQVKQKYGRLDAIVNNAGITIDAFFEDHSDADVRKLFEVNFFGVLELTRQALPLMRQRKSGRIVTIGSIAGQYALPQVSIYSAIKFALEGWSEALRFEVAPFGVCVSIIEPCFVQTNLGSNNRSVGEFSSSPSSAYYSFNKIMDDFYESYDEKYSKPPEAVARLVYKALSQKKPKIRYMLGRRETFFYLCKRLLPQKLYERIYNRVFPSLKLDEH